MKSIVRGVIGVTLTLWAAAQAQVSVADSSLKAANRLYNAGSYESAELTARRLMEQGPIADSVRVEAERVIAFSLVAQGKSILAREHFESILVVRPTFILDPILTSPKILTVFQEAKQHFDASRSSGSARPTADVQPAGGITFRAVLFPGWEQYHRGRTGTGSLFAGAGIVSLGSALVFEALRAPARKDYLAATQPSEISSKYSTYNRYYRGEIYSLIAFATIYVASEVDVFLNANHTAEIQASIDPSRGTGFLLSYHW